MVNQIDKFLDSQSVFLLLISSTFPKTKLVLAFSVWQKFMSIKLVQIGPHIFP